ncbi:unnamed protein product [Brassica rapa subsp. narinosa]
MKKTSLLKNFSLKALVFLPYSVVPASEAFSSFLLFGFAFASCCCFIPWVDILGVMIFYLLLITVRPRRLWSSSAIWRSGEAHLRRVSRNGGAWLCRGVSSSQIWASLESSLSICSGGVGWWRVGSLLAWCLAAEAHLAVIQEVFGVFFTDACKESVARRRERVVYGSGQSREVCRLSSRASGWVLKRTVLWFSEVEQGGYSVLLSVDWSRRQLALKLIIPAPGF